MFFSDLGGAFIYFHFQPLLGKTILNDKRIWKGLKPLARDIYDVLFF